MSVKCAASWKTFCVFVGTTRKENLLWNDRTVLGMLLLIYLLPIRGTVFNFPLIEQLRTFIKFLLRTAFTVIRNEDSFSCSSLQCGEACIHVWVNLLITMIGIEFPPRERIIEIYMLLKVLRIFVPFRMRVLIQCGTHTMFESLRSSMRKTALACRAKVSDGAKCARKGGIMSKRNHKRTYALANRYR